MGEPGNSHLVDATWMDILQFHADDDALDESTLYETLKSCLNTPGWDEDPIETRLYDFLALCWPISALRVEIHKALTKKFYRRKQYDDFISCIENTRKDKLGDKKKRQDKKPVHENELDDDLQCDAKGNPKETFYNLSMILQRHEEWKGRLRFDTFQNTVKLDGHSITDAAEEDIAIWLGRTYGFGGNNSKVISRSIHAASVQDSYDPLMEWVDNLPKWDETERLETWLIRYCGASPVKPQVRWIAKAVIIQMIARALEPGCMARLVPILEGPENKGKTRAIKILGDPWSITFDMSMDSKEAHMAVAGVWVAELSELDTMRKTTETRLKSFISQQDDAYVPKYSNHLVRHPRRTVFFGTTNEKTYLKSGDNTRWLPVQTSEFNLDGLARARNQLFAEALHLLRDNPSMEWWEIPADIEALIKNDREERTEINVYYDDLVAWLDGITVGVSRKNSITWKDLAVNYLRMDTPQQWKDKSVQYQVFNVLARAGWHNCKVGRRSWWERDGLEDESPQQPPNIPPETYENNQNQTLDDDDYSLLFE